MNTYLVTSNGELLIVSAHDTFGILLKIIVSRETYLVTSDEELLIVQNIVRNGSLGERSSFSIKSGSEAILRHLVKAHTCVQQRCLFFHYDSLQLR